MVVKFSFLNWIFFYRIALNTDWLYSLYVLQAVAMRSIHLDETSKRLLELKKDHLEKILQLIRDKLFALEDLDEIK